MKILLANRIAPDGTPRSADSHLGLCGLPMSYKKDTRTPELSKITLVLPCGVEEAWFSRQEDVVRASV